MALTFSTFVELDFSLGILFWGGVRFINLVQNLDPKTSWENVKIARKNLIRTWYNENYCAYLLPNEYIEENFRYFMYLVNASSSNHHQQNLTKDDINEGAKMFIYLNTCPNTKDQFFMEEFFQQVFKKFVFEPTNSGIILYTLNAMKLYPNDGRIIAMKILKKVSSFLKLSYFQSEKRYEILTKESMIGKFTLHFYSDRSDKIQIVKLRIR